MDHPFDLTTKIEHDERLDGLADKLDAAIPDVLRDPQVRSNLKGDWLGHALHPMLTDVPVGAWTSAALIDLLGPRSWQGASTMLTGIGLAATAPTIATGLVEFQDLEPRDRRAAAVHAASNVVGTSLMLTSFVAKLVGKRGLGVATGALGLAAAGVGGYLGGHLSYHRGAGVDATRTPHAARQVAYDEVELTYEAPVTQPDVLHPRP